METEDWVTETGKPNTPLISLASFSNSRWKLKGKLILEKQKNKKTKKKSEILKESVTKLDAKWIEHGQIEWSPDDKLEWR